MNLTIKMPRRTPPQKRADESLARFNLSIWGRQSGKTTRGYRKLIWKPLQSRTNSVYWHILQTYAAADIVFDRYMRFIHPHKNMIMTYKNESERRIELIGNRNIFFKSGQNFEDLRTESLDGVVIDEARQQQKELWTMVVFPMLAKSNGWADIMTTPNGYDWIYDLKKDKESDPSWGVTHAPSWEAWWWSQDQINEAKKNMSELEFRQEIGAEFVNLRAGKVYYAFSDANKMSTCPWMKFQNFSPYHPVILGLDFNVNPMCWALGQYVYEKWWWFDEIRLTDSNTPEAARALRDKLILLKEQGHRPPDHDVIICGDASGNARSTKGNESDYEILKQVLKDAGIRFRNITPLANPSIKDRVNAVNAKCQSAGGDIGFFINPETCKWTVHDLERVVWKQGADFILDPGKDKMLTHASDAIGYPIAELSPVKIVSGRTKSVIIPRSV